MSRMLRAAVAAVLVILLLEAGARALEPALPQVTRWREPMVAAKVARMLALKHVDLVLAGSSQMLSAGDPTMLHQGLHVKWTSYNAGLWGSPPVVTEHWLTKVVEPLLHPATVVLGVSPVDFVPAVDDSAVQSYFNSMAVRSDWLGSLERKASDVSVLVRHRHDLRTPKAILDAVRRRLADTPGPPLLTGEVDVAGHSLRRDTGTFRGDAAARELIAGIVRNGWTVSSRQRLAFERTVRALEGMGTEVLVAEMAVSRPLIDLLGPRGYADFRTFLRNEARTLGVPLLDMAAGVVSTSFFSDYDHVNHAGAVVFNTALARALAHGEPGDFRVSLPANLDTRALASATAAAVLAKAATP